MGLGARAGGPLRALGGHPRTTFLDTGLPVVIVTMSGHRRRQDAQSARHPRGRGRALRHRGLEGRRPRHPSWYYNLHADPAVRLQDGPDVMAMTVREVEGDERAEWWAPPWPPTRRTPSTKPPPRATSPSSWPSPRPEPGRGAGSGPAGHTRRPKCPPTGHRRNLPRPFLVGSPLPGQSPGGALSPKATLMSSQMAAQREIHEFCMRTAAFSVSFS